MLRLPAWIGHTGQIGVSGCGRVHGSVVTPGAAVRASGVVGGPLAAQRRSVGAPKEPQLRVTSAQLRSASGRVTLTPTSAELPLTLKLASTSAWMLLGAGA